MKKNVFLIDMDDTLFDFCRTEELNLLQTLAEFGISADKSVWSRFHEINQNFWQEFEKGKISKAQIRIGRFKKLFEEYGYFADICAVSEAYFKNFKEICIPFDGAVEFVKTLRSCGRVYLVTNGNTECQMRHVEDAGLLPLVDGVFISDEIGFAKPSKEFNDYVAAHIDGFNCNSAVWIGDSLSSDMQCAYLAGIDFILFTPNGAPENYSGISAKTYGEILKILQ